VCAGCTRCMTCNTGIKPIYAMMDHTVQVVLLACCPVLLLHLCPHEIFQPTTCMCCCNCCSTSML
jgi:hypothetical protein